MMLDKYSIHDEQFDDGTHCQDSNGANTIRLKLITETIGGKVGTIKPSLCPALSSVTFVWTAGEQ